MITSGSELVSFVILWFFDPADSNSEFVFSDFEFSLVVSDSCELSGNFGLVGTCRIPSRKKSQKPSHLDLI